LQKVDRFTSNQHQNEMILGLFYAHHRIHFTDGNMSL